jgi:potassium channel LctB
MHWYNKVIQQFQLTPGLKELREFSPFTFAVERFFFILQFLSISNLFFGTRQTAHELPDDEEMEEYNKRRARYIDYYVIGWMVILIILALIGIFKNNNKFSIICIIVPSYRVFDIFIITINMTLFDHLRVSRQHTVISVTRILLLTLYNYLEIMFAFGIIYSVLIYHIKNADNPLNGYYFSVITQLTIGYGDLVPLGYVGTIAIIQGIVGFVLVILVVARFVTLMPRINERI